MSANPHAPQADARQTPHDPVAEVAGGSWCASLPGFQFLACVGRSDTTESWRVRTPENRVRQIKFVRGFRDPESQALWERLITFRDGSHPALLAVEVIQSDPGRVVLLSDLVERTLADRMEQCRRQKLAGIPRAELLGLLQPVAEALDTLFRLFRVHHLNLSPKALLLDDGRLMMADVGLLQVTDRPEVSAPSRSVLRSYAGHAAPEWVMKHQASPTSDQYSLALIFAEALTGVHPLGHLSRERAARNRERWRPSLELLPTADREVLARALHFEPFNRYPTCAALMAALREGGRGVEVEERKQAAPLPAVIFASGETPVVEAAPDVSLGSVVTGLVRQAAGTGVVQEFRDIRFLLRPGELLQHRCAARLLPGVASIKLDGFRVQWRAEWLRHDHHSTVLRIPLPRDVWQFCLGREVALEVEVQLFRPDPVGSRWTEIGVRMRPRGCAPRQAVEVLDAIAPVVLESLRSYLQVIPEMRTEERLTCAHPIRVAPVFAGQKLGGPIECQGKDISLHGIGFYLPQQPPSRQLYVQVPTAQQIADLALLTKVVHVKPFAEGWYEVGAEFVPGVGRG